MSYEGRAMKNDLRITTLSKIVPRKSSFANRKSILTGLIFKNQFSMVVQLHDG